MTDDRYKKLMADVGMPESLSLLIALKQVANEVAQECAADKRVTDDLVVLTSKLVRELRKAAPDNKMSDTAMDYLKRHGLFGSPLRDDA